MIRVLLAILLVSGLMAAHLARGQMVLTLPGVPDRGAGTDRYTACLAAVAADPMGGLVFARDWEQTDGGNAARDCAARALMALGRFDRAAAAFGDLADEVAPWDGAAAQGYNALAAQIWLMDEAPDRARRRIEIGQGQADPSRMFSIAAAMVAAAIGDFDTAAARLDDAYLVAGSDPDLFLLEASVRRHLGDLDLALAAVTSALVLRPGNEEALLERGNVRLARRQRDLAAADWRLAAELAPGSAVAAAALANLSRLTFNWPSPNRPARRR